jgi:superfamily I DNA/RNA helicase
MEDERKGTVSVFDGPGDEDKLPLRERVETAGDEVELEDVYETERRLFYVACTRARDRLLVTGIAPGSEFLADLRAG